MTAVAQLAIIWDYDTAIGRVNSSYPYKFDESKLLREIENVETILQLGQQYSIQMTFACVGFAAEEGAFPYHIPQQIARMHAAGHEIASHSWKHEWFPFLERRQIELSLQRSRDILGKAVNQKDAVTGFVPPFSRPMSWLARGAFSLGDRMTLPRQPGADMGSLLPLVNAAGYSWCRIAYRPFWKKIMREYSSPLMPHQNWSACSGVVCVPSHYIGFDTPAQGLLEDACREGSTLVVSGHPSALDFGREESLENLTHFLQMAAGKQDQGILHISTINSLIGRERMDEYEEKRRQLLARAEGVIFPYSETFQEAHREFALKMWPQKNRRRDPRLHPLEIPRPGTGTCGRPAGCRYE